MLGVCVFGPLIFFVLLPWLPESDVRNVRLFFDHWDVGIYFSETAWIGTDKRLYHEVWSEYPFAANLVFGAVRVLANVIEPLTALRTPAHLSAYSGQIGFAWVWMSVTLLLASWMARQAWALHSSNLWLWLSPPTFYFCFYRFDVFPVFFTMVAMLLWFRQFYISGIIALGIAIALKGYPIVMLAPLFPFLIYKKGFWYSSSLMCLSLAPLVLGNLFIFLTGDLEAMLAPYKIQMSRELNGESSYDALLYLIRVFSADTGEAVKAWFVSFRPGRYFQILLMLIGLWLRPRTFRQLTQACLFMTLGFMNAAPFYSPQFFLWLLPFIAFLGTPAFHVRSLHTWSLVLIWMTFLYFPVAYDLKSPLLPLIIVLVTLIRFFMMALSLKGYSEPDNSEAVDPRTGQPGN